MTPSREDPVSADSNDLELVETNRQIRTKNETPEDGIMTIDANDESNADERRSMMGDDHDNRVGDESKVRVVDDNNKKFPAVTLRSFCAKSRALCVKRKVQIGVCVSVLAAILFIFVVVVLARAGRGDARGLDRDVYFTPRQIPLPEVGEWTVDGPRHLRILADAVKYRTVSHDDGGGGGKNENLTVFSDFARFLEEEFPSVHDYVAGPAKRTVVGGASLLYEIEGADKTLKPYLLIAHLDVVPAENADQWDRDPFGGDDDDDVSGGSTDDEYLYGRGTLDVKSAVVGILAALETKLSGGARWRPKRGILCFFGHDEEIGGFKGAKLAADSLKKQGVTLEFILDEGAFATRNFFPGVEETVGLIGVAEKGYFSVELEAEADAGHSSMPPEETAIGKLAEALTALERNPLPYHFGADDINRKSFEWIAPYLPFGKRLAMTNIWLFKGAVLSAVTNSPETRALARTTTALTVVSGGVKDNVLPKRAKASINHRLHPGDDADGVLEWDKRVTAGISGITFRTKPGWRNEASKISPHDENAAAYHLVKSCIHAVIPDSIVIPYLTVGGTDSKHFVDLTDNIYRFVPYVLDKKTEDAKRIHGINERIRKSDFSRYVEFYLALIEQADRI